MSYTILLESTTADITKVNDNFYHNVQGAILPRTGNSLTATTGVYDIGSSTYKWDEIYVVNSYANTYNAGSTTYELLTSIQITTTSSSIEITGLNGDVYNHYVIDLFARTPQTTSVYYILTMNQISAGSYTYSRTRMNDFLTTSNNATGYINLNLNVIPIYTITNYCHFNIDISGKSGYKKIIKSESFMSGRAATNGFTTTAHTNHHILGGGLNDTNTLTSVKISCVNGDISINPGTKLNIWQK